MSTNCKDCSEQGEPVIAPYAKGKPLGTACNTCGSGGPAIIVPPGSILGKDTEIIEGPGIIVDDLSDSNTDRFRVSWDNPVQLEVDLTMVLKNGPTIIENPVLWGTVITFIEFTWSYNKSVIDQDLDNTGGLPVPALLATDRLYAYVPVVVKNNSIVFTITGNDGKGLDPESIGQASAAIIYGNYLLKGIGPDAFNTTEANLLNLVKTFESNSLIDNNRNSEFFAESAVLERDFYLIPKRFGFATFSKNGGTGNGGFKRMKIQSGIVRDAANFYTEDPFEDTFAYHNGLEKEEYLIYMSVNDNIGDSLNPITVT